MGLAFVTVKPLADVKPWTSFGRSCASQWPRNRTSLHPSRPNSGLRPCTEFLDSPLGDQHLAQLRTTAVRALKAGTAGASPQLRLSLVCPPGSDPGFYQLLTSLLEFQHACARCPGFLEGWTSLLFNFAGRFFQDLCLKVLQVCGQVHWPWPSAHMFVDEEGVLQRLATLLRALALRAWLRYICLRCTVIVSPCQTWMAFVWTLHGWIEVP